MDARALAAALNGQAVSARQVLAPGPGHSPTDRSMSVLIGSEYPDGFWCHSFTDDHWQECRDHVRRAIGLGNCRTVLRRPLSQPQRNGVLGRTARTTTTNALAFWGTGGDAHDTLTERYLQRRKLSLPVGSSIIRHVANFGPRGEPNGIMLTLMHDVVTDHPVALLRTYISQTATKTNRKFLGPTRGAAIKLAAPSDLLYVAEGVEPLSLHQWRV
jgi:putative DNA primase/helicase